MFKKIFSSKIKTENIIVNLSKFNAHRKTNHLTKVYEKEKGIFNKEMKKIRKDHAEEFWKEQTKIENDYINTYIETQQKKRLSENAKLLNSIIKNSVVCYKNMQDLIERQQTFIAKQRIWRELDAAKLAETHDLLSMLDHQSKSWLTPENINTELNRTINSFLPPTIISHEDYYHRLHTHAMLYEQGRYEEAEDIRLNRDIVNFKNKLLEPIYNELRTVIYHLTYNEETAVVQLYNETILRIKSKMIKDLPVVENLIETVDHYFKRLITLIRIEAENPNNKVEIIERQLQSLITTLILWVQYTDILYLPEKRCHELIHENENQKYNKVLEKEGLINPDSPDEFKQYFFSKITENFSKNSFMKLSEESDVSRELGEDVLDERRRGSERVLTDEDVFGKRGKGKKEKKSETKGVESVTYKQIEYQEEQQVFQEKAKDENEDLANLSYNKKYSKEQEERDREELEKFDDFEDDAYNLNEGNKTRIFEKILDENYVKEQKQNENVFSGIKDDIINYKASLVKKFDLDKKSEIQNLNFENFDISKIVDMNELEIELRDNNKHKNLDNIETNEVFNTLVNYSKDIYDFQKPKLLDKIDIYDEDLMRFLDLSVMKENIKASNRTSHSLVMHFIAEDLKNLDESSLSPKNKIKRKHLIKLCEVLSRFSVKDAENLSKIFDMFKRSNKPLEQSEFVSKL